MSADERSCLEGVYTVRRSEKQAADESEQKLWQIVDSLLSILAWTGNQYELAEEGAHDHIFVL